jgi:hypothetical protein
MIDAKKTAIENLSFKLSEVVLPISSGEIIGESIGKINKNYDYLYQAATAIEDTHMNEYYPVIEYYEENKQILHEAIEILSNNYIDWTDFYTTVQQNSALWLLPMSVFYPTLMEHPLTPTKIDIVGNWLKKYFPIKNDIDNTLNFVERQRFIVSCYTYQYASKIQILDQPYSYCNCSTRSGVIALHCQTKITGGWVNCNQGSYNCSHTLNCYPTRNVDCWYESPYLKSDGTPIRATDPVSVKQVTQSKIQANINMEFVDRRENSLKNLVFEVEDCDWVYVGEA